LVARSSEHLAKVRQHLAELERQGENEGAGTAE
jgi:hypothetical protein